MINIRVVLLFCLLDTVAQAQEATTTPTTINDCDTIAAGDIYFTFIRSKDPVLLTLFPFEDIPGDIKLYLTDNAWTGSGFQANEGTLELTVPSEGIPQATDFGYGPDTIFGEDWVGLEGAFSLEPMGEQVFLYCIGATGIVPLAAISNAGPFSEPGLANYGFDESALPTRLATNGTIELEQCAQWQYAGTRRAESSVLKASMINTDNWKSTCESGALHLGALSFAGVSLALGLFAWMLS